MPEYQRVEEAAREDIGQRWQESGSGSRITDSPAQCLTPDFRPLTPGFPSARPLANADLGLVCFGRRKAADDGRKSGGLLTAVRCASLKPPTRRSECGAVNRAATGVYGMSSRDAQAAGSSAVEQVLGYLNFSSGPADVQFLANLNRLFEQTAAKG